MNIEFTNNAWIDFEFWLDNDPDTAEKIRLLIKSIKQTPFKGLGKPEALKYNLKGYWSRRINGEHRLVYEIMGTKNENQKCIVITCRLHYK